jgi:threonine/homoserine/homoserine lactone efflux protein
MQANVGAFLAIDLVIILVPGPNFALISRNTLRGGRDAGILTGLGATVGLLGWGAATVLGLATLLAASSTAYEIVKVAGAAYLVVLGARTLWRSRHRQEPTRPDLSHAAPPRGALFRQGLLNSLLNPKSAVLYTSLLPQFIPSHAPLLPNLVVLAAINTTLGLTWFCVCAFALHWVYTHLWVAMRWIERVSGVLLIALGIRVATAPR